MVKSGCADVATGKRRMLVRRTSAFIIIIIIWLVKRQYVLKRLQWRFTHRTQSRFWTN